MDQDALRSGTSFWRAVGKPPVAYAALEGDVRCEAAVVGGGITGALVAHSLGRAGVETVIVDREDLANGSTAASTGLLQYEIDTPLLELIGEVGEEHAVYAYRRGLEAIDELEEVASRLPEGCDFTRRPTLYLASSSADMQTLRGEHACRQHYGFDVQLLESADLKSVCGLSGLGGLWSRGDGELDPYRFTQGVLHQAVQFGVRPFGQTGVTSVEELPSSVVLTTPGGRLTARAVIFATGYTQEFLPTKVGKLHTTYAAVSEPLESFARWPERCLIWETARPYFYARTTADGRALIGGGDTSDPTDHEDQALLERKVQRLTERFEQLFPAIPFRPACSWAGAFAETRDGLPFIGPPPGRERIYFALGYGGNGITFSMIAARLLTDLFLGRPNPDAAVFRFGR